MRQSVTDSGVNGVCPSSLPLLKYMDRGNPKYNAAKDNTCNFNTNGLAFCYPWAWIAETTNPVRCVRSTCLSLESKT